MSQQNTKDKIIQVSKEQFLAEGFKAASMGNIAKSAGVPKSLLYHYFANKEALWLAVKQDIVSHSTISEWDYELSDLETNVSVFLEKVIWHRYYIYQNPEVIKLLEWQKMQNESDSLKGGTKYSPDSWVPVIKKLQKMGEINPSLNPIDIKYMIVGLVQAGFMHDKTSEQKRYIKNMIYILTGVLAAKS